jgi:hypothetical protein
MVAVGLLSQIPKAMSTQRLFSAAPLLAATSDLPQACIRIIGNNDTGFGDRQNLRMLGNGVTVSGGHCTGGGGTITNCNYSYSLSYDDAIVNGLFPVHYLGPGAW